MAKDPAFLFYTGDFQTGTQFFTDEQVGKYVRLLLAQHQHGHLHEKHMLQICKTHDKDIFNKFLVDKDGLFYNKRLEDELVKRKSYSKSRAENRKKKNICNSYDSDMENKNSISNIQLVKHDENEQKFKPSGNFKTQGEELFAYRTAKSGNKLNND
jgi:uncharacterized protein YdaU (DUF1376 family)